MEKIFLFLLIFLSSRHLPKTIDYGVKVFLKRSRIRIQEQNHLSACKNKVSTTVYIFKSSYCFKKQKRNIAKNSLKLIFTSSKKKKPSLKIKEGFELYIPIRDWGFLYFK